LSDALERLLAEYGLDPTRGGMLGTLRAHVDARLAQLGITESSFVERVRSDTDERERLIHRITVRHSWFYRDPRQLDGLLERMQARQAELSKRPLDVWVAGCAAGEEAWTLAMLAADAGVELRLRATDVDMVALQLAQLGEYGAWSLRELPERLRRFIEPCGEGRWRVTDELRSLDIEFAQHNLCDPPLSGSFDVISCRNVLIYFIPARAQVVVAGLRSKLHPGGELVLGAGDLLFQIDERVRGIAARAHARGGDPQKPEPARVGAVSPDVSTALHARAAGPKSPLVQLRDTAAPPRLAGIVPSVQPGPARVPSADADRLGEAGRTVEAGNYEVALAQLASILDADPLDAEAHLWTGIAQYGLGREQLASEALRRARCLAPQLWPATLFAALTNERRGLWTAAGRCWAALERAISASDAPLIEGTTVLLDALPRWRAEALALARQRISKHADGKFHD
jgi:chemotaxis protein methyltransferase CheR